MHTGWRLLCCVCACWVQLNSTAAQLHRVPVRLRLLQVTCSQGGHCISDLSASFNSSVNMATAAAAPVLTLISTVDVGAVLTVPRESTYTYCNGTMPTAAGADPYLASTHKYLYGYKLICLYS